MSPFRRSESRQALALRPIHISFDALARSDGSARFSFGSFTSGGLGALSSVNGPIEVRLAAENASEATLEILVRPLSNVPATESKALAATLRLVLSPSLILTHNPRTLVQIVTQALAPSSSSAGVNYSNTNTMMAAMVNASTLALLNAGSVPMRGVVCAVSVARRESDGELVVDPDQIDGVLNAEGCFAFMFLKNAKDLRVQSVWTDWRSLGSTGEIDTSTLDSVRSVAMGAAREVYEAMFKSVEAMRRDSAGAAFRLGENNGKIKAARDSMDI